MAQWSMSVSVEFAVSAHDTIRPRIHWNLRQSAFILFHAFKHASSELPSHRRMSLLPLPLSVVHASSGRARSSINRALLRHHHVRVSLFRAEGLICADPNSCTSQRQALLLGSGRTLLSSLLVLHPRFSASHGR